MPRRRKQLRRTGAPKRRKRINAINRARRAWKFKRNFHSREFVKWTKRQPCATCGERAGRNQTSHVIPRAMGGCKGTWKDTISQCRECHEAFEASPKTWPAENGHDMRQLADEHHERWLAHQEWKRAA